MFSHSLRKVECVIGRKETYQIAYITRDPLLRNGTDSTNCKQCHVFQTDSAFEVEEIEAVLSNAFHRNASSSIKNKNIELESNYTPKTPLKNSGIWSSGKIQPTSHSFAHLKRTPSFRRSRPTSSTEKFSRPARTTSATDCQDLKSQVIPQTSASNRKNGFRLGFSKSRKQLTQSGRSAAFFQRIFGNGITKDSGIQEKKSETLASDMTPVKWQTRDTCVKFRQKEESTKFLNIKNSPSKSPRKRKSVSAVFSHSVLQRISTATGIGKSGGGFGTTENSKALISRRKIQEVLPTPHFRKVIFYIL